MLKTYYEQLKEKEKEQFICALSTEAQIEKATIRSLINGSRNVTPKVAKCIAVITNFELPQHLFHPELFEFYELKGGDNG